MSARDDGGPAFPVPGLQNDESFNGMTLRDYFAAKAMQAYLSSEEWRLDMDHEATAKSAYRMADAMLKERVK